MGIVYLDASIAVRTILDVPERVRLQAWMGAPGTTFVSSRLLRTDVIRVLRRDGRPLSDGTALLDRVGMFDITRGGRRRPLGVLSEVVPRGSQQSGQRRRA